MGCPIRRFPDQGVFAPPRNLSQRITSFIACACQGIHQMPLRHLIVLIANDHHPEGSTIKGTKRPASRDLSGGAVRLPTIMTGIERPGRQRHPGGCRSEQIFSSQCQSNRRNQQAPQSFFLPQMMMNKAASRSRRRPAALSAAATPSRAEGALGLVELSGIEPLTPCLQSRCSPS